jgi:protein-S-isoprenylcysteine O-methyltransferase Ste14
MATDIDAVAGQFIEFYYQTFDSDRAGLAALYVGSTALVLRSLAIQVYFLQRDNSMLSFEGAQTAGAAAIVEKLVTLPFQKVQHKVTTKDAQPSSGAVASLLVSVTGMLVVRSCSTSLWPSSQTAMCRRSTTARIRCSSAKFSI